MTSKEMFHLRQQHQRHLQSLALTLTHNRHDADDLVQETWLAVIKHFNRFQVGTNFKAWVRTIMRNRFINQYRQVSRRREILDEMPASKGWQQVKTSNDGEIHLLAEDIMREVNALPDLYRIPFLMSSEGYKIREIGEQLSLPEGTVKSRIFTARRLLQKRVKMA